MKYVLFLGKAVYPLYYLIEPQFCLLFCFDKSADKSPKWPWDEGPWAEDGDWCGIVSAVSEEDSYWCDWVPYVIAMSISTEYQMEAITMYLQVQILD